MTHVVILALLILTAIAQPTLQEQAVILNDQLESLHPDFLQNFYNFFHHESNTLQVQRVTISHCSYLLMVGKMYLYAILPSSQRGLQIYNTQSRHLAAYYYLKMAADRCQNSQAYYTLGIMEHYKLVPDKIVQHNLQKFQSRSKSQQQLLKYVQQTHMFNSQSNLFLSSASGFNPASLVLAYMNKNRLGTSKNCTTALAYYLSVIKSTYVEQFFLRQIYTFPDSFEDQLYMRKRLPKREVTLESAFIEDTDYYDQETIEATIELADNYYMGSGGYSKDLKRAAKLYEKLAQSGSAHGKLMAGMIYFKGQGVVADRKKAKKYFEQTSKDDMSEFMLLAYQYFQILEKNTKPKAIKIMQTKLKESAKSKKKLNSHMNYLIGAAVIKGELTGHAVEEGYKLLDSAVLQGSTMAKVLLGILFADGAHGLKYGCEEATKYFSEEALVFPFFKERMSTGQLAIKQGLYSFGLFKYMQLGLVGYENAYINALYLLQVYSKQSLDLNLLSWQPAILSKNQAYKLIRRQLNLPQVHTFLKNLFTIKDSKPMTFNDVSKMLVVSPQSADEYHAYVRKKVIRWGAVGEKKNILKYYDYKLRVQEGEDVLPTLISLSSGDSNKLYVSQSRYLLGKLYHSRALKNKKILTQNQLTKIRTEYNRATKSELLGSLILHLQDYLLGGDISFVFFESDVGKGLLAYIFVLAIVAFAFYYLRSKRMDDFHRHQMERQQRRNAEQKEAEEKKQIEANSVQSLQQKEENVQQDRDQPMITQDPPQRGVRIGSSEEDAVAK